MDSYQTSPRMAWGLGEISEYTGLSLAFLRAEVRAGRLPVRRFGRRVLVRNADLQAYLDRGSERSEKSNGASGQDGAQAPRKPGNSERSGQDEIGFC
jgi:excisionase family DNA binding protein